ncbi:hypothetical protein IJI55_02360 [Candidatus Saccharibacteria bacterium]|nr:hypothetical protein [Candidatus Saccharibacteria bacterium]
MNVLEYAKGVEKTINPMDVGTTHHMQKKLSKLPVFIQRKIVTAATKKATKMGFVVEPYAFFLFYELSDPARVLKYLPDGFEPEKCSIFEGDKPKYYGSATIFRLHTSVFWGARVEFYVMARNTKTGLLSWIILDYISDTISYDKKHGLRSPEVEGGIVTTTCEGDFVAEMISAEGRGKVEVLANLEHHKMRKLDEQMWIDGNTSIAYGREIGGDDGSLFSLTFFPEEMDSAWELPLSSVREAKITFFPEVFKEELDKVVCFPYAQHMLSDSPGQQTHYGSVALLRAAVENVDFKKLRTFSQK